MNFWKFLSEKALSVVAFIAGMLVTGLFLYHTGTSVGTVFVAALLALLFFGAAVAADFADRYTRMKKVRRISQSAGNKLLLGEMLPGPFAEENRAYYAALREVSHAAVTEVRREQIESRQYAEFIESFVHEIKTPLTACSLIAARGGSAEETAAELERVDNCVETVLYYARAASPEKDLYIKRTDLRAVAAEALAQVKNTLIAARLCVYLDGEGVAFTDGKWVCFIIKQLLVNAAKYAPGKPVYIDVADNRLSVRDSGPGIPAHELARATEKGFTGTAGRQKARSSGMGLYIVNGLCRKLNIGFSLDSPPGRGLTARLTFGNLTEM